MTQPPEDEQLVPGSGTTTSVDPPPEASGPRPVRAPSPRRPRARWLGWAAAIGVVVLTVARLGFEWQPVWTVKSAVALVVTGVALPQFILLLRKPGPLRGTALAAAVFLIVVALAAAVSPLVGIGYFGGFGTSSGVGWIFYLVLVAFWALGATLDDAGTTLVADSIIIASVLDAIASILSLFSTQQSAAGHLISHIPGVFVYNGQSLGLMDNSVFSGGLLAGGIALVACSDRIRARARLELLAVLAVGLGLSGSKFGMFVVVVLLVWLAVRSGLGTAGRSVVAVAIGVVVAAVLDPLESQPGLASHVAGTSSGGTFGARLTEWSDALRVVAHHPLLGVGPGQGLDHVAYYYTRSFTLESQPLQDAHNFVVEILLTTGILGLASFSAWLVLVLWRARGPLLACALGMLAVELVEPLYVGLTPIAFLALGAASTTRRQPPLESLDPGGAVSGEGVADGPVSAEPGAEDRAPATDRTTFVLRIVTTAVAVAAALSLLVGGAVLNSSSASVGSETTAGRLLPPWPEVPGTIGAKEDRPRATPAQLASAVSWFTKATQRDPNAFISWDYLAAAQVQQGDLSGAARSYSRALAIYPWYPVSLANIAPTELAAGHPVVALAWYRKADVVDPGAVNSYQIQCLEHLLARTSDPDAILAACPASPSYLQLFGLRPPGWISTPGVATS